MFFPDEDFKKLGHIEVPLRSTIPLFIQIQDKYVVAQKTKTAQRKKDIEKKPLSIFRTIFRCMASSPSTPPQLKTALPTFNCPLFSLVFALQL